MLGSSLPRRSTSVPSLPCMRCTESDHFGGVCSHTSLPQQTSHKNPNKCIDPSKLTQSSLHQSINPASDLTQSTSHPARVCALPHHSPPGWFPTTPASCSTCTTTSGKEQTPKSPEPPEEAPSLHTLTLSDPGDRWSPSPELGSLRPLSCTVMCPTIVEASLTTATVSSSEVADSGVWISS